jgi:hypothetical protein
MTTKRKNLDETQDLTPDSAEGAESLGSLGTLGNPETPESPEPILEITPKQLSPVLKALSKPKVPEETAELDKNELIQFTVDDTQVAQVAQGEQKIVKPQPKRTQLRNTPRFSAHK